MGCCTCAGACSHTGPCVHCAAHGGMQFITVGQPFIPYIPSSYVPPYVPPYTPPTTIIYTQWPPAPLQCEHCYCQPAEDVNGIAHRSCCHCGNTRAEGEGDGARIGAPI